MEALTVTILEPKVKKLLEDLANMNLIKVQGPQKTPLVGRKAGSAEGKYTLAPDFDEPLEDFKEYM